MAWRWLAQAVEDGVVVDPRDFVRNENELAQEFGGYFDRDNVGPEQITPAKPVAQAFVIADGSHATGSPLQTLGAGQSGAWTEITSVTVTPDLEDGEVIVDGDVACQTTLTTPTSKWQIRLLVNGYPVAYSGWVSFARRSTCVSVTGSMPIVTGSVAIQLQIRAWTDPQYHLTDLRNGDDTVNVQLYNPTTTFVDLSIVAANIVYVNRRR